VSDADLISETNPHNLQYNPAHNSGWLFLGHSSRSRQGFGEIVEVIPLDPRRSEIDFENGRPTPRGFDLPWPLFCLGFPGNDPLPLSPALPTASPSDIPTEEA